MLVSRGVLFDGSEIPRPRLDGAKKPMYNPGTNYLSLNWFSRRISEPSTVAGPTCDANQQFLSSKKTSLR